MINDLWKALQQPEYLHIVLNHLPITGLGVAALGLFISLVAKNRGAIMLSLGLVFLLGLSAWPVVSSGQKGYDDVYSIVDKEGEKHLDHHMELGERWSPLFYVTSLIALVALLAHWASPQYGKYFAWLVLCLALGSLVAGAVIAESGGKVRHPEFRKQS